MVKITTPDIIEWFERQFDSYKWDLMESTTREEKQETLMKIQEKEGKTSKKNQVEGFIYGAGYDAINPSIETYVEEEEKGYIEKKEKEIETSETLGDIEAVEIDERYPKDTVDELKRVADKKSAILEGVRTREFAEAIEGDVEEAILSASDLDELRDAVDRISEIPTKAGRRAQRVNAREQRKRLGIKMYEFEIPGE